LVAENAQAMSPNAIRRRASLAKPRSTATYEAMLTTSVVSVAVTRAVPRHTLCEHCGAEFVYHLERTGVGTSGFGLSDTQEVADAKAAQAAAVDLWRELDTGAEPVPCPECFKYQSHMTEAARAERWGRVRHHGGQALAALPVIAFLTVIVFVVLFPKHTELAVGIVLGISAVLLLVGAIAALVSRFGKCVPNDWPEEYRKAKAEELALTRDDFDRALSDGGPYVSDLVTGFEADYAGVLFLWVLPEEIENEDAVPFDLPDGTEIDVELSDADDDGVFLSGDRLKGAPEGTRVCLRLFNVYKPASATEPA
jgi:hypothetical protein